MKISDKNKMRLYTAIADPIMDERIMLQRYGSPGGEQLDNRLFKIQNDIWKKVCEVLKIEQP